MYWHYALMGLAAACMTLGIVYRPACAAFAATFTYAHLCDKSNYLNHNYLVSLLAALLALLPLDRQASLRVWLRPDERRSTVPRWMLPALAVSNRCRFFLGGLAKIGSDWLLHAEPLRIWLSAQFGAAGHRRVLRRALGRVRVQLVRHCCSTCVSCRSCCGGARGPSPTCS